MLEPPLWRRLVAEGLGSAFLAAIVIGSGIAAQQLSPSDVGLQLFENAAATAAGLFAIILMFGGVSGAHFNPVVSLVDAAFGGLSWRDAFAYLPAQVAGCIGGAVVANIMFSKAAVSLSTKDRASGPHFLSEVVATMGLLLVIFALARTGRSRSAPAAVGAYIGAAYFFTSSTSFANPAITVGRMFSNTFAGIAPSSAPVFIAAQVVGGGLAVVVDQGPVSRCHPGAGSRHRLPASRPGRCRPTRRRCPVRSSGTVLGGALNSRNRKGEPSMRLVAIGGSDAGISAALRAREIDPTAEVTVVVADPTRTSRSAASPTTSRVRSPHWGIWPTARIADLEATGMRSAARHHGPAHRRAGPQVARSPAPTGPKSCWPTTRLVVGTGAVPVRPPIDGLTGAGALGPAGRRPPAALDGRHLRRHGHPGADRTSTAQSSSAPGTSAWRWPRPSPPADWR